MGRTGWQSSLILVAALAAAPLLAKPQVDFPLIRIPTLKDMKITKEGKSKPIVASRNGSKYIFKANRPFVFRGTLTTRHGNFEAELITNAAFKKLGMRVPNLYIVRVEGRRELHLRIRFAGDRFTDGAEAKPLRYTPRDAPMDDEAMRNIQLVDLLVANMDRHGDNVLMFPGEDGVLQPVPIDHNLAFLTSRISEQRGWLVQDIPAPGASRQAFQNVGDTYVSKRYHSGAEHWNRLLLADGAADAYRRQAQRLQDLMTDEAIDEMVNDIPDEVLAGIDGPTRKEYLRRTLRTRRSQLVSFFQEYVPRYREAHGLRPEGAPGGQVQPTRPRPPRNPPPRRGPKRGITGVSKTPDVGPAPDRNGPGRGRPKNWLERLWGE